MSTLFLSDDHWSNNDPYELNNLKKQALEYVLSTFGNKVNLIVHAADLTDKRTYDAELISKISFIYLDCLGRDVSKLIFLAGNHCGSNRLISPMTPFVDGIRAMGGKAQVVGNSIFYIGNFSMRGWDSNLELAKASTDYLVLHARIFEWAGTTEKSYKLINLETLGYKTIICGDTHRHQKSGSVISIGTMAPSNHRDDDLQAGFGIFDEESNIFERKLIPNYPIFRTIRITEELEDINPFYVKGNIVKLIFKGKQKFTQDKTLRNRWKLEIMAMEPRNLEISPIDENEGDLPEQEESNKVPLEQRYNNFTEAQGWSDEVKKIGNDL